MYLGKKASYFTHLNSWAIKGDDSSFFFHDSRVRSHLVVTIFPDSGVIETVMESNPPKIPQKRMVVLQLVGI
jgi:hypothetical protein